MTTERNPVANRRRAERRPCKVCGQPIQAGQLYIAGGPLHVYCSDVRAPGRVEVQRHA